jgi:ABC-type Fe3+-hydroxamate transport system substrate-binding protein
MKNKKTAAQELISKINQEFTQKNIDFQNKKAAYLIWKNPYITVGRDTYIHSIMAKTGIRNVFSDKLRYPETSVEELHAIKPDFIFLSSEPYPFKEKDLIELQKVVPDSKIVLVDGEMFSWYGSRMLYAADYLKKLQANIF